MGEQKKSSKAGRRINSNSAKNYIASGKRYTNKIRKVKRHAKRCGDANAERWLKAAMAIFSLDYKRGSEPVRNLHDAHFGHSHR